MQEMFIQAAGLVGVGLIVGAYFMLQVGRIDNESPAYSLLNLVGAALVLATLVREFNLAAFIIEGFWIVISAVGLIRSIRMRPASD